MRSLQVLNPVTTFADFFMLTRVARKTYQNAVGTPELRKALAFAIYVKRFKANSVVKDWSYRELARLTKLSPTTCKKRIDTLKGMGLVRMETKHGHSYLRFLRLRHGSIVVKRNGIETKRRPRYADIRLGEYTSIKEIEQDLMALVIVEDTKRKNYARQLISLANNPRPKTSIKRVKKAQRLCRKRGYGKKFIDGGLSYRRIAKWLHCSPNTVKNIICFGESTEMFVVERRELVLVKYVGNGMARFALPYIDSEHPLFATRNNVYYKPSLLFTLPRCQTL